ncbi:MAG: tetratricopeptide repeat protein [Phycisphaerae bacterium]|nr:tetratricopeptide repeat protein [Phycisphaerae bacterium]
MSRYLLLAGVSALLVLTICAYLPVFQAGFIWDDDAYVTNNWTLRSLGGLLSMWTQPGAIPQYYPLTHTTFWFEYHLWRANATGYHLVNVLLHVSSACLIWLILRRLALPGAWFVAAIFALHPVHVESVAWITERKNTLSGMFYFLSMLAYLEFRPLVGDPSTGRGQGRRAYVLSLAAFCAALLSKSITCSLPAALLLLTWWKRGRLAWRDVLPLLPFFAVGIIMSLITVWMESKHVGAIGDDWALSPLDRILIAGHAVWFYAGKLVWPVNLAFIYHRWEIDAGIWWQYLYPAAALAVLVVLWFARRRIGRGPLVAGLFFGGTLVPALGFVNIYPMRYSFVADHFQYLASLGIITLIVGLVAATSQRIGSAAVKVAAILGVAVLALLGTGVWRQTHIYKDLETLWRDTLDKTPTAVIAMNNLGRELIRQKRGVEAIPYLQEAVHLRSHDLKYRNNLASAYLDAGRLEDALRTFRYALRQDPNDILTNYNFGCVYAQRGRFDQAIPHFKQVVQLGAEYEKSGRRVSAAVIRNIHQAREALARALLDDTKVLLGRRQRHTAVDLLTETLPLIPEAFEPRRLLADLLAASGRPHDAVIRYRECLDLQPESADVLNALAWLLATHPDPTVRDGKEAVALAERAVQQHYKNASVLDTLAAALAETGQFDRAVEVARQARDAANRLGARQLAESINKRLQLYTAHIPYRETFTSSGAQTGTRADPPRYTR